MSACLCVCPPVRACVHACVFIARDIVQGQSYLSVLKCYFLRRNGYMRKTISSPNRHTVLSGDNSLPALLSNSNSQSFLVHHADKTLTTAQRYGKSTEAQKNCGDNKKLSSRGSRYACTENHITHVHTACKHFVVRN